MKPLFELCKGSCGESRYIINRKHGLCQNCNYERLHGKGSLQKKQQGYANKLRSGTKKSIKPKSAKQSAIDAELSRIYAEMAKGDMICSGCGTTKHLSHSHIIRRSWNKDLEAVRENITYHCLIRPDNAPGCHSMWESDSERIFLNDYQKNMEYIKQVDPTLYWKIFYKEKELGLR